MVIKFLTLANRVMCMYGIRPYFELGPKVFEFFLKNAKIGMACLEI